MSVKAGSHDTVGFNAWDEEVEVGKYNGATGAKENSSGQLRCKNYIPVVGGMTYHFKTASDISESQAYLHWYDGNKNHISGENCGNIDVVAPSNACYACFHWAATYGTTYKNDTCFNLAWDGERNGEYEPYEKHSYPLAEVELRGIPKLDANNKLYYDGDTYESDGTITRKYGIVDLGGCNWSYNTNSASMVVSTSLPNSKNGSLNCVCKNWTVNPSTIGGAATIATLPTGIIARQPNNTNFFFRTDSTDATAFKTSMSGVYFVYELDTPTTEEVAEYQNPQVVDDFGTEEYVDYAVEAGDRDVSIPVGHNSKYMNNLRAKLEMAPDSPDGDGDYIVRQTNGLNSYVPYTADGRLTALESKVPAPPSSNGTYKLTATVNNGTVTYSWTS